MTDTVQGAAVPVAARVSDTYRWTQLAIGVLAIVLGDKAEEAFRQSLLGSQGSLGIFFSNTLVSTIMILGLIALFWSAIQQGYTRLRGAPA